MRALIALAALAACGAPTAPRNRAGVIGSPAAIGGEYERFLDDDADHGSWSVGLTVGLVFDGDAFLTKPRHQAGSILAINPLVRWHAYRPTDWLTLGLDGKLSLLWYLPDHSVGRGRFALALESHLSVAADYERVYGLVGVGVKHFVLGTTVEDTWFPVQNTMQAGEASLGLRW